MKKYQYDYASVNAKAKTDRFVKIIFRKEDGAHKRIEKFSDEKFKIVDGNIYEIRKDNYGNTLLSETCGFVNAIIITSIDEETKEKKEEILETLFTKQQYETWLAIQIDIDTQRRDRYMKSQKKKKEEKENKENK
jgi:hypothetical protein